MGDFDSDAVFSAIADPTRRAILRLLGEHEELTAGEIAQQLDGLGRTAVSSHLRILRLARLVAERREGRYRHYSVTSSPADVMIGFLTSVYQNSLQQLASAMQDATDSRAVPIAHTDDIEDSARARTSIEDAARARTSIEDAARARTDQATIASGDSRRSA